MYFGFINETIISLLVLYTINVLFMSSSIVHPILFLSAANNVNRSIHRVVKMFFPVTIAATLAFLITINLNIKTSYAKKHKNAKLLGRKEATEEGCENTELLFGDYERCGVYHQCSLDENKEWVRDTYACPNGNQFDDELQTCSNVPCDRQVDHPKLPEDWKCKRNHDKHVLPTDCRRYYTCFWTGSYYTFKIKKCHKSADQAVWFNDVTKSCTGGDQCPQEYSYLPEGPGWSCKKSGRDHFPHPEDCTVSYKCKTCDYGKWCVKLKYCPQGQIFSGKKDGKCVPGMCPKKQTKVPEGWTCSSDGELNVVPHDCKKYYKCLKCKDANLGAWCYEDFAICPQGHSFDNVKKICVHGRCRQFPPILPPTWQCEQDGENSVHPNNCTQYYTCIQCPDNTNPWCYTLQTCQNGQTYDDTNKACVDGRCPQLPPVLPEGWNCSKDGEKHVKPDDCDSYYICRKCKGEWSYEEFDCCAGSNFDEVKKICVIGRCPQDPKELPKGWICEKDGEKRPHPDDCSQYYTCKRVENKGKPYWSYELCQCENGQNFDDVKDTCVAGRCPQLGPPLPRGWTCETDGNLHVHPDDCTKFYKCLKVSKSEWSYELKDCAKGRTFDDCKKACVSGRCPQWPEKLPDGWKCDKENGLHVHPTDCSQCYTCVRCKDSDWCIEDLEKCPIGQNFDDTKKKCVKGRCPQDKIIATTMKPRATARPAAAKPEPVTPPPGGPPTSLSGKLFNCPGIGRFKHERFCSKYWECWKDKQKNWWATEWQCPILQYYNTRKHRCVLGVCLFGQGGGLIGSRHKV